MVKRTAAGFNTFFGEGEYFSAVEFGWFPNDGESNEGSYHVTLWHIDTRTMVRRPNDRGIAVTLEQQVGCNGNLVPFLRYAYGHRGLNGIRQNLSIGLGIEEVLGHNFDLIGVAASWEEPSNPTLRDQYIFEAFYRFHITPHTHLTPDIQIIIDPANAPTKGRCYRVRPAIADALLGILLHASVTLTDRNLRSFFVRSVGQNFSGELGSLTRFGVDDLGA